MTDTSYRKHLPLRLDPIRPWRFRLHSGYAMSPCTNISLKEDEAFAAFLVRAANCHDQMIAALEWSVQLADIASDWSLDEVEIDGEMHPTFGLARHFKDVIAQARGERP